MLKINFTRPQFDTLSQKYKISLYIDSMSFEVDVYIDKIKAQEILLATENIESNHSNIYELFSSIVISYEITIETIEIVMKNQKLFALINFSNSNNNCFSTLISISNALVLSIKNSVPIFISESLINHFSPDIDIIIDDELNCNFDSKEDKEIEKLQNELVIAINNENYEVAALIRDKIKKINGAI